MPTFQGVARRLARRGATLTKALPRLSRGSTTASPQSSRTAGSPASNADPSDASPAVKAATEPASPPPAPVMQPASPPTSERVSPPREDPEGPDGSSAAGSGVDATPQRGVGSRRWSVAGNNEDDDDDLFWASHTPAVGSSAGANPAMLARAGALWADPETDYNMYEEDREVKLHLYHTDGATAWLNWLFLEKAEVPIYHAGVEVYGYEWSFQYFDDAWDDESISGVLCCEPKSMVQFTYQNSISLGKTNLSEEQVYEILERLRKEWPASHYHLTRNNCLTFARTFVALLNPPEPFPPTLLGFGDAPSYMPHTDRVVDFGWTWYKWSMQQQQQHHAQDAAVVPPQAAHQQPVPPT